ncbi:MAG TPA: helix-turn-helix transcriptional regulator [Ktedonobacteraceae bacterium]|nr:helix-turn-helix transcriptional regulator [Ktedonobacteraceae bacterium]
MATLRELRINAGWSIKQLAEHAGITRHSAGAAEKGQPIRPETAKALADALSKAHGRDIKPLDIEGLHIV